MLFKLLSSFRRILPALIAASVLAVSIPFTTQAAAVPAISIVSVKPGESVTIQAENFPAGKVFNVRMDVIGKLGVDGTIVTTTNTGTGSFEATYLIPASLKTEKLIAIRLDGYRGYFSYNWFDNKGATVTPSPTPTPTTPGTKPYIIFTGVQKDAWVTVQANRFPTNEVFTVRMGPFYSYASNHMDVATINSGNGGTFSFTINLPASLKGVELVTVLLSGSHGNYAYNAFVNATTGTVTPVDPPVNTNSCAIISATPTGTIAPKADFDAIWTVKNTSTQTWDRGSFDYQYVSGTTMHRFKIYDFKQEVKPGETIKIIVDMVAPSTAGTYTATWAIVKSTDTQCTLPVTVKVK
jgi:hypothetical protein